MSNIPITQGTGASSVATETISGIDYQKIKVVDGTAASTNLWKINADGTAQVSIFGIPAVAASISGTVATTITGNPSVSGTVGASIIGAPPANLFMGGTVVSTSNPVPVQTPASGFLNTQISGSVLTTLAPTASLVSGVTSVIVGTASVTVLSGAPGGQRNYITNILATNGAATGTFVNIYDGGNVVYAGYAAASGGGFSASFPVPLRQASAQGALCAATTVTASVVVAVSGYTAT